MAYKTTGHYWLSEVIANGVSRGEIARVVGRTTSTVSRWASGHTTPDAMSRYWLERIYKIEAEVWL